jgi:hypothetical protein
MKDPAESQSSLISIFNSTGISRNLRKVHDRMSLQVKLASYDKNVSRVSNIIKNSGIEGKPLKLPQIMKINN